MKKHSWLWGLSVLAIIIGCSSPDPKEQEQDNKEELAKDVRDEINIGKEIGAKLLGHMGAYNKDPAALEYVNLVGQTLAKQSGRPEIEFHFAILDDPGANAFAAPGGFIFVTKGLLKSLNSESELAAVLGHEIAHINEKHMYNEIRPKKDISANETVARMLSRGRADIGGSISKIVGEGLKVLLEKGYGQEKEESADKAGALYASASGYNPVALKDFLVRLEKSPQRNLGRAAKTHPPFPQRIQNLDKFLSTNGLVNKTSADEQIMEMRFSEALKKLRG